MYRNVTRRLTEGAILAAFFLIPVWYRLPFSLVGSHLYVTRFLLLLPMLVAIFSWLIGGLQGLRALRKSGWGALWAVLLLAVAVWGFFSQSWAFMRLRDPDVAANAALQFGIVALFAVVVASSAPPLKRIMLTLTLALIANAVLTIGQAIIQNDVGLRALGEFAFSPDTPGVSVVEAGGLRWVRPYGLLPHPNILAGSLLVGLFAASTLIFSDRQRWRVLGMVAVALGFGALLLTFSRAAWIAFAGGGVVILLLLLRQIVRPPRRRSVGIALALLIGVGVIFVIAYRPLVSARAGVGEESLELRSVSDRLVLTDFALRSIRERTGFGVGIGNFPWRASYYISLTTYDMRGDNVHQVYLSAAAELGLYGLVLYLGALASGMIAAVLAVRGTAGEERAARVAFLAAAVGLAITGFFDHYPYTILQMQTAWWGCIAASVGAGAAGAGAERRQRSSFSTGKQTAQAQNPH